LASVPAARRWRRVSTTPRSGRLSRPWGQLRGRCADCWATSASRREPATEARGTGKVGDPIYLAALGPSAGAQMPALTLPPDPEVGELDRMLESLRPLGG